MKHIIRTLYLLTTILCMYITHIYAQAPTVTFNKAICSGDGLNILNTTDGYIATSNIPVGNVTNIHNGVLFSHFDTLGRLIYADTLQSTYTDYVISCNNAFIKTYDGGYVCAVYENSVNSIPHTNSMLVKYDAHGNIIWMHGYPFANDSTSEAYHVIQMPDSGFVISGYVSVPSPLIHTVELIRVDKNGKQLWQKQYNLGVICEGSDIYPQKGGTGMILTAVHYSTINPYVYYLYVLDNYGNIKKQINLSASPFYISDNWYSALRPTADGGYIIWGNPDSAFHNGSVNNGMLIKLDSNFNITWRQFLNGSLVYGQNVYQLDILNVRETADKGYILCGYSSFSYSSDYTGWAARTDSNGNILWQYSYEYDSFPTSMLFDVTETPDGGYVFTGFTVVPSIDSMNDYIWLLKLNSDGQLHTGTKNIMPANIGLQVYPNPTRDAVTIRTSFQGIHTPLSITNMLGQTVYSHVITSGTTTIDTHTWPGGVYLCTLYADDGSTHTCRFIIQH